MEKANVLDFKKEYRDLYLPGKKPALVDVPDMLFIAADGEGAPEGPGYQNVLAVLYALTFTIKFSKMSSDQPKNYVEYKVPPLEGLWASKNENRPRESWRFTSMIRQPTFVTPAVFAWAKIEVARKKPELDLNIARLETWREGLCVQAMHTGPYATESETIAVLHQYMRENDILSDATDATSGFARRHHEIYLGDPRRAKPENLKTVLRLPVRRG